MKVIIEDGPNGFRKEVECDSALIVTQDERGGDGFLLGECSPLDVAYIEFFATKAAFNGIDAMAGKEAARTLVLEASNLGAADAHMNGTSGYSDVIIERIEKEARRVI